MWARDTEHAWSCEMREEAVWPSDVMYDAFRLMGCTPSSSVYRSPAGVFTPMYVHCEVYTCMCVHNHSVILLAQDWQSASHPLSGPVHKFVFACLHGEPTRRRESQQDDACLPSAHRRHGFIDIAKADRPSPQGASRQGSSRPRPGRASRAQYAGLADTATSDNRGHSIPADTATS